MKLHDYNNKILRKQRKQRKQSKQGKQGKQGKQAYFINLSSPASTYNKSPTCPS